MKNSFIAYTAGMVDGEGSIQINPSKSAGQHTYWGLTVQVSSGNKKVLDWLCKIWNLGHVTVWQPKGSRLFRQSCNWRIYSKEAEIFLKSILPYLKIKKENAKIAIEFRKYIGATRGTMTKVMSKNRRRLAFKMKEINQRYGKGIFSNKTYEDVI